MAAGTLPPVPGGESPCPACRRPSLQARAKLAIHLGDLMDVLQRGYPPPDTSISLPLEHASNNLFVCGSRCRVGSGFKLRVQDLTSLTLNLGPHTTSPLASIGLSVDYEPFYTVNVTQGSNVIPLHGSGSGGSTSTITTLTGSSESGSEAGPKTMTNQSVVRINVEGWQNNRINLETIVLNGVCADCVPFKMVCEIGAFQSRIDMLDFQGAKLVPYVPSKLAFQFIGDSLSAVRGPFGSYSAHVWRNQLMPRGAQFVGTILASGLGSGMAVLDWGVLWRRTQYQRPAGRSADCMRLQLFCSD